MACAKIPTLSLGPREANEGVKLLGPCPNALRPMATAATIASHESKGASLLSVGGPRLGAEPESACATLVLDCKRRSTFAKPLCNAFHWFRIMRSEERRVGK